MGPSRVDNTVGGGEDDANVVKLRCISGREESEDYYSVIDRQKKFMSIRRERGK